MPKREIEIGKIRWDATDLQARADGVDAATVREYAERMSEGEADSWPAVTVFDDGEGNYWPADGWHTGAAAEKAGFGTVRCDVREGTRLDALKFAVGANARHGRQRTSADKRRAVQLCLDNAELGGLSDNAIAELCNVHNSVVAKVRAGHVRAREPERRTGADGKSYPAKREKAEVTGDPAEHPDRPSTPTDGRASVIRDIVPIRDDKPKRPALFVDRFDDLFGPLVRFMDEAAAHFGAKDGGKHRQAMNALNLVAECYGEMRDAA